MWLYIIYPIEKYEYIANTAPAKKVLALKARTLEPYGVHTHRTYGLPWKYESGTVEKGKTVRWTQTTQLSRPMAGPVLPYLPTALQLNRATVALSLGGRLSRRDGGGWGVGGCWSWDVPRCARLLLSPPLFPVPTPPPVLQSKPYT